MTVRVGRGESGGQETFGVRAQRAVEGNVGGEIGGGGGGGWGIDHGVVGVGVFCGGNGMRIGFGDGGGVGLPRGLRSLHLHVLGTRGSKTTCAHFG